MSEYTTRQILDMIETNEGPNGLDLSGKVLRGIDLSRETIQAELARLREEDPEAEPVWVSSEREPFGTGGINLELANLQGAWLGCANLQGAYLGGADLHGAHLECADLQRAHLANANLQEARLDKAKLQNADLRADLQGADLLRADLQNACLRGAELQRANLAVTNLQGADLRRANFQGACLVEANLQGAYLGDANLQGVRLSRANLQGAELRVADLQGAGLVDTKLQGADLWFANLQGAWLAHANLKGANLVRADLQEAHLGGTNLQDANLGYAHLEKVDFFTSGSLEGAYFYDAFLDDTRLRRKQLGRAIGEELAGRYDEARDVYLRLKRNFDDLGDYAASAWAYQKERQMEKACNAPWRARGTYGETELGDTADVERPEPWFRVRAPSDTFEHRAPAWHPRVWLFYARHTLKWLSDWFVEYLCGYGESIWRVLFWMFASFFGFAAYYWRIGGVWVVKPNGEAAVATSFWHYLIYSAGAFTTTQFAKLQAADDRVRMITAIQAIVGIVLAGLLGFVAGNRIRRS